MFTKESVGSRAVDAEHVNELIILRRVFEVLHANVSLFTIHLHDHRLNEPNEHLEILEFPRKDPFRKFDTWCIDRILEIVSNMYFSPKRMLTAVSMISRNPVTRPKSSVNCCGGRHHLLTYLKSSSLGTCLARAFRKLGKRRMWSQLGHG